MIYDYKIYADVRECFTTVNIIKEVITLIVFIVYTDITIMIIKIYNDKKICSLWWKNIRILIATDGDSDTDSVTEEYLQKL